ncbi:DUF961 family protein [Macrococcoides canis]|uniref:DUF961 family protein n=1 Tax=Macrococcoides canis TaxID=1855823 RepID=UPI0022B915CC|nr:DUF961 family protein [Macrococcus canis]WBF54048.1 YdcP family protein [Macrococcus canis]
MKPVLDIEKTLGELNFMGVDEKYKYENGERTNQVQYAYKLSSREQGEQITVKTPNKVEMDYLQKCELVNADCNIYVQSNGNFSTVAYSFSAEDIKPIGVKTEVKQPGK